ncbi:pentapeptide repeat-containing protein [Arsenophonus endosymbiont of Apis mellifera]|nr:pentapeptide repeat-containing protein [Arsenophonus endosymbiont of Apis mellifera]
MSNSVLQGANLTKANLAQANLDDVKKQLCKSAEYSSPPFCIKQLK